MPWEGVAPTPVVQAWRLAPATGGSASVGAITLSYHPVERYTLGVEAAAHGGWLRNVKRLSGIVKCFQLQAWGQPNALRVSPARFLLHTLSLSLSLSHMSHTHTHNTQHNTQHTTHNTQHTRARVHPARRHCSRHRYTRATLQRTHETIDPDDSLFLTRQPVPRAPP